MYSKQLFNSEWMFRKAELSTTDFELMNGTDWQAFDLPHDWMIYNTENLYEEAKTCYKKTFYVSDPSSKHTYLCFEGVYMNTLIYVNEEKIFEWPNGYSTFYVDLTRHLLPGENTIYVINKYELPNSRWYPGSGIYRDVWLYEKGNTRITFDGTYVSTQRLGKSSNTWELLIDTECETDLAHSEVTLIHILTDCNKEIVAKTRTNLSLSNATPVQNFSTSIIVENPLLWDTITPNLYTLTTLIQRDEQIIDQKTEQIGFREISFDPDTGFYINDTPLKIHGACLHDNLGSLGCAVNKEAIRRQFISMQKMGVNSIRTAHNMPAPCLMELADEMGMLIYSESFDMWESNKTDYDYANFFSDWWKKDLASWVRRDRNHPSLIIWGIGNEIHDTHYERGIEITRMLHNAVRLHDPRKNGYTALGSNYIEWENAQKCAAIVDLVGYNYLEKLYDEHHKKYPDWCIFGSETSSTVQSRGIYHFPADNRLLTFDDLQCSSLSNCTTNWGAKDSMTAICNDRDHSFSFGQYIWSGWDYLGEPTPYFTKNSYFGQVDTAGFEKDTYYVYQAEWTSYKENPMVHLLPYWDWNEGQLIDIRIYSNAPKTELFFNDKSLGIFAHDHINGHQCSGNWQIPYKPGTLRAVAYDENDIIIAEDIKTSFTDAVQIKATPNKENLLANGSDLIFVSIETCDKNGTFVANAKNRMNVEVTGAGRLIGLDNGDSTDTDSFKGTSKRMFSGRLLAIIAAKDYSGDIFVKITSPELQSCSLTLHALETTVPKGISCTQENSVSEPNDEIPVRKIELTNLYSSQLNSEQKETEIIAKIYPENASYRDLTFKAMTLHGVESNCVKIEKTNLGCQLTATGDGEFRLCCFCNNGRTHADVISELEFHITGLGTATTDPYHLVSAINHNLCSQDLSLSFEGGVYITNPERTYVTFENVDFGDYGSDEIHLPIFSFADEVAVEVWEGIPDSEASELLVKDLYQAKSWYNHYQENVFQLKRRVKGTTTISIVVEPTIKMSLQGFYFTKKEKSYEKLFAADNTRITGDKFTIKENAITGIGNNVTLEYENMNFSEKAISSITICGHSPIDVNSIHIRFYTENEELNQIVEFSKTLTYEEKTFQLEPVSGPCKVNFIFLPGSNFDLKWFQFN